MGVTQKRTKQLSYVIGDNKNSSNIKVQTPASNMKRTVQNKLMSFSLTMSSNLQVIVYLFSLT